MKPNIVLLSIDLLFVLASFYVGLKIASRYREHNRIEFILVGITAIIISEPIWPPLIEILLLITIGELLPFPIYWLIAFSGIPIGLFTWIYAMTELMYKQQQKKILSIIVIYIIIFELLYIPYVFLVPDPESNLIAFYLLRGYYISFSLVVLITGLQFAWINLISDNPVNATQGKILVIAFTSYSLGNILSVIFFPYLFLVILYTISLLSFYLGFTIPKRIRKYLL